MTMRASLRLALAALVSLAAGSAAHARDPVVREMFNGAAVWHQSVCDHALSAGTMRCHSQMRTDAAGTPLQHAAAVTAATPNGYGPADLHSAYNIPTTATGSSSVTVAIVDAYGAAFPATAPGTIAVGGTSPVRSSTARGWTESVWYTSSTEGTGSGSPVISPSLRGRPTPAAAGGWNRISRRWPIRRRAWRSMAPPAGARPTASPHCTAMH